MSKDVSPLYFPSGLSITRAKKLAKERVKSNHFRSLSDAQNSISQHEMKLPWSLAIAKLKNKTQFMSVQDIKSVMNDMPHLTYHGIGSFRHRSKSYKEHLLQVEGDKSNLLNAVDECNKACFYLQHMDKRKTVNYSSSSYGLKHAAEKYLRKQGAFNSHYVSNGALICAAHHMGFTIKGERGGSPNVYINYSARSPIVIWRKLQNQNIITATYLRKLDVLEKQLHLPRSSIVSEYEQLI